MLSLKVGDSVKVLKTVNKNKEYCITFSLHSLVNVYWDDESATEISNYEQKELAIKKRNTNNYSYREKESKPNNPNRKRSYTEIYEQITGKPIWY